MKLSDFQSNIKISQTSGLNKKIGIVKSLWNIDVTDRLYNGCVKTLTEHGVNSQNITTVNVPGSFELIYGSKKIIRKNPKIDAVIAIGSIIQGETPHFNFICQAVANGIKDLNILFNIPFIFCVTTDLNKQQALDRAGGKRGNKGVDSAYTALQLIQEN